MLDEVILLGGSGHALVVAETAILSNLKLAGYAQPQPSSNSPFNLAYLGDEKENLELWISRYRFILGIGDNRDNSHDSRFWGFIPYENVVGTPIVVYWSWDTNMKMSSIVDKLKSIRWSRIGTLID